ncbi:glycine-rich domain-containing protein [Streptomyces sp. NPDC056632]|uniref:glycine-rich domain-containing protein n=1 Tax=Streptomyces sp. NPDC056632 TaxID=3345884 RepID=UPI0036C46B61
MTVALERPVGTTATAALIGSDLADRLAGRIVKDYPEIDPATADRIINQTAAFLAAGARLPGQFLVPSPLVDIGWHTFILHTVDYADFCQRIAGRFIHHVPTDDEGDVPGTISEARDRTIAAISAAGYWVDLPLWQITTTCTQCHAGCTDSPVS